MLFEDEYSRLPTAPLEGGPVLCLDSFGVIAPTIWRDGTFYRPPAGFIGVPAFSLWEYMDYTMHAHPALPDWAGALDEVYTHCG